MNDTYPLFVEYSLQQCAKEDYADPDKVKAHNAASKKLRRLLDTMRRQDSEEVLCRLLDHDEERVRVNAASACLQLGVAEARAVSVLRKLAAASDDPTIGLAAQMLLQHPPVPGPRP